MIDNDLYVTLTSNRIPDDISLSSVFDIETILDIIKNTEEKIDYYKGLKKHRNETLDSKISDLKHRSEELRDIVLRTMKNLEPKKNTLHFPDVGKVTRRKGKEDWEFVNENEMMSFLDKEGLKKQIVKTVEVIDYSSVKDLLNNLVEHNKVVPGVRKITKPDSVSITFDDKSSETSEVTKKEVTKKEEETKSELVNLTASDL